MALLCCGNIECVNIDCNRENVVLLYCGHIECVNIDCNKENVLV